MMNRRVLATLSIISLTTALFAGAAPANADDAPNFEEAFDFAPRAAGYLVQVAEESTETLPVPNAIPSDEGTVLVTWYGQAAGEYCEDRAVEDGESCGTLFQIFDTEGVAITDIARVSDVVAPYYYGQPSAAWNSATNEWVIYWTTYNDKASDEAGVYLQRISRTGALVGDTFAVSDMVRDPDLTDDPDTEEIDESLVEVGDNGANPTLVSLGADGWLLVNYNYVQARGGNVVSVLYFDEDLTPSEPEVIISNAGDRPYGAIAAIDSSSGTVLAVYINRQRNAYVARAIQVSAGQVSTSGHIVLLENSAQLPLVMRTPGLTYVSGLDSFAISFVSSYSNEDNETIEALTMAKITLGEDVMTDATDVTVSAPVRVYDSPLRDAQRSWVAYDSTADALYVSQTYLSGYRSVVRQDADGINRYYSHSISVIHELKPSDFSLVESVRIGETESPDLADGLFADFYRSASRITLNQTGDTIAYAYMSWIDQTWGDKVSVRFGVAGVYAPAQTLTQAPPTYSGPTVQPLKSSVAAGATVRLIGSSLGSVSKVEIDGYLCDIVSNSAGELVIKLPKGLKPGLKHLVLTTDVGVVTIQSALTVSGVSVANGSLRASAKRVSESQVKVWVFDAVGAGKVQILVNGREVAWVRATASGVDKLRTAASGERYLVRTVRLAAGKNVIEVFVDGKRSDRWAYTLR
jgi:hypothetical protein